MSFVVFGGTPNRLGEEPVDLAAPARVPSRSNPEPVVRPPDAARVMCLMPGILNVFKSLNKNSSPFPPIYI